MPKIEAGTVLVYIAVGLGVIVIVLLSFIRCTAAVSNRIADSDLYEKPTWTETIENTTVKEIKDCELSGQ